MPAAPPPPLSSSPAAAATLRVWDLPTRLFHAALAVVVIGLVVTAKTGAMDWHFRLGYSALALLLFRLLWGIVGGHWSRFGSFVYGPGSLLTYLRGQAPPHHRIGHTPLGALSVFALLGALVLQVATGLMADDAISVSGPLAARVPGAWSSTATSWHKDAGQWVVIALVALHVAAVLFYVLVRRERLIRPMVSGDKRLADGVSAHAHVRPSRDDAASRGLALVLFGLCAGVAYGVASLPP